jgi:CO/xanthine dehydrogenase FAD-binding subunit
MSTQFFEPGTVEDAIDLLRRHGGRAELLAGGTDLVVQTRQGARTMPEVLVHLGRVQGLETLDVDADGALRLGSRVSHAQVVESAVVGERWTALSDASALVGSPATRHIGTVGGNLCNGSPAMEIGGPLLAFEARVELAGPDGRREMPLHDFLLGPRRTARSLEEVLVSILVPPLRAGSGSAYLRLEFRQAMEIAIVGATACLSLDEQGIVSDCRIALTAVAPTVIRAREAEGVLLGGVPDEEAIARAAEEAARGSAPISDVRSPAGYRREMVRVMTARALRRALDRCASAAAAQRGEE